MTSIDLDRQLLIELGGPSKVAEILGYEKDGGAQRVQNWLTRGIPSHVKVANPALFMPKFATATANIAHPATETVATEN